MKLLKAIKNFMIYLCAINLFIIPAETIATENNNQETLNTVADFREWVTLLDKLHSYMKPSDSTTETLIEHLDYDSTKIIDYVSNYISYEAYTGVLRGAEGTLRARAGNALDQSILLAKMLKDSGNDARIVSGVLSFEQGRELLKETFRLQVPFKKEDKIIPSELLNQIVNKILAVDNQSKLVIDTGVPESKNIIKGVKELSEQHSLFLLDLLRKNGHELKSKPISKLIDKQVQQYYWVQYRIGGHKTWKDIHPAYPKALIDQVKVEKLYLDKIPNELTQEFEIQAFVRRRIGDKIETIPLMKSWRKPVSIVQFNNLNFSLATPYTSSWSSKENKNTDMTFVPMINNNIASEAMAFDLRGNVAPIDVAFSSESALFKTLGSKMTNALDLLTLDETKGAQKSIMAIEEVWLDVSLHIPDSLSKKWKRSLYLESSNPSVSKVARYIHFSFITGGLSPKELANELLLNISNSFKVIIRQYENSIGIFKDNSNNIDPSVFIRTMIQSGNYKQNRNTKSYRNQPLIIAYHQSLLGTTTSGFDILNNSRMSMKLDKLDIHTSPEIALKQGVWETVSETIAAKIQSETFVKSTVTKFNKYIRDGNKNISIISNNKGDLKVYSKSDIDEPWWRVDDVSGTTLGIIQDGWGGVIIGDDVKFRLQTKALTCVIIANLTCIQKAKAAGASVYLALYLGADIAWNSWGLPLPPDFDVKSLTPKALKKLADKLVQKVERKVIKNCYPKALSRCVAKVK